jgi:hypothetical protein
MREVCCVRRVRSGQKTQIRTLSEHFCQNAALTFEQLEAGAASRRHVRHLVLGVVLCRARRRVAAAWWDKRQEMQEKV